MPYRVFISVDLPAPFSPTRACTVPRRTVMLMSELATTPGNRLVIPASATAGGPASTSSGGLASLVIGPASEASGDHAVIAELERPQRGTPARAVSRIDERGLAVTWSSGGRSPSRQ